MFHSDLRPANILLTEENHLRIAPYGLFPKDLTGY